MGIDVGEKRIGIAISDPMGWTAQGHSVLHRTSIDKDLSYFKNLCQKAEIGKIVVGLPKNMNGSLGPKAREVQQFGQELAKITGLPVEYWDERLTTLQAERVLLEADLSRKKRRGVIDKVAAVHILQSYLDVHG